MASKRILCIADREPHEEYLLGLIRSQLSFGLTYLAEARAADGENRSDFGEAAREIALNSYHSAVRFAMHLPKDTASAIWEQLQRFRDEMEEIWPESLRPREIA